MPKFSELSTNSAPAARYSHTAVWTGSKMIVWGGNGAAGSINTGGVYDAVSNTWTATPVPANFKLRQFHTAVWTGTEMIIYGGFDNKGKIVPTIARYNPSLNAWINSPPKCTLVTPTNNTVVTPGSSLSLTATASDNNGTVTNVQFYYNSNILIGSSTGPVYSVTWSNIPAGLYTVTARATDDLGTITISATNTVIAPAPPTVSLVTPTNSTSVVGPTSVLLSANAVAVAGTINSVQFFSGNTLIGSTNTPPFDLNSGPLAPGNYTFSAVASNSIGLLATSTPSTVYILTKPKILTPEFVGDIPQYSAQVIPGQFYIVDATTNLTKPNTIWIPIATNQAVSNILIFTDPEGTNFDRRFYRWRQ